jgi:hypothetical protein
MPNQPPFARLIAQWPDAAIELVERWQTPAEIASYLEELGVDDAATLRSPLTVLRDRLATPLDGALLACAALRAQGHPPRLAVAWSDDEGLLAGALFARDGGWALLQHRTSPANGLQVFVSISEALVSMAGDLAGDARSAVVELQALDAQDWMGDDAQLGGLLAAIESALGI